jgi:hypothetical protein
MMKQYRVTRKQTDLFKFLFDGSITCNKFTGAPFQWVPVMFPLLTAEVRGFRHVGAFVENEMES